MNRMIFAMMVLALACVVLTGATAQVTMVSGRYAPQCVAEVCAGAFTLGLLAGALAGGNVRGWGWLAAGATLLICLLVVSDGVFRLVAIERFRG